MQRKLILALILVGILLYANSFSSPLIWDDHGLVSNNSFLRSWKYIPKIFTQHIYAGQGFPSNFYRPLQNISYLIDYTIWKLNPFGYHLTNTAIHIFSSILVFMFINLLTSNFHISAITSILFLFHPVHTEAVTYVAGRAEPLMTLFILVTLIAYIRFLRSKDIRLYILSIFSFIFALLSKELALVFPLLLLTYEFYFNQDQARKKLYRVSVFAIISVIYIILRLTLLNFSQEPIFYFPYPLGVRFITFFKSFLIYLRLLILPFNLHMQYQIDPSYAFIEFPVLAGLILFISFAWLAVRLYNQNRLLSFGLVWFFITLLAQSNLFPINAFLAEHFLYLPSIGAFFVFSKEMCMFKDKHKVLRPLIYLVLVIILFILATLTVKQNNLWKDPIRFYKHNLKFSPDNYKIHNNIAGIYKDKGEFQKAEKEYLLAIKLAQRWNLDYIKPIISMMHANLGDLYQQQRKIDLAISHFQEAVASRPVSSGIYIHTANILMEDGQHEKAITMLEKALEVADNKHGVYFELGKIYENRGDIDKAVERYKQAKEANLVFVPAYSRLGFLYDNLGKTELALKEYRAALNIDSGYPELYNNLGIFFSKRGDFPKAQEAFEHAISLKPSYSQAYFNLGVMCYLNKDFKEAKIYFIKALMFDRDLKEAKDWLAKIP